MNALRLFVFAILLVFANFLVAQEQEYQFNHYKSLGESNVIYIKIANLSNDEDEQSRVLGLLLNDSNIIDGQIYSSDDGNPTCQLEVNEKISVVYLRSILQSAGYDIDLNSIASNQNEKPQGIYYSERVSFFDGFEGWKGYDINDPDAENSEDYYKRNKDKWIKQNPESYEKAKVENGTQVVVKRKDLEFFKEEKRQHILNHPEIFIIED